MQLTRELVNWKIDSRQLHKIHYGEIKKQKYERMNEVRKVRGSSTYTRIIVVLNKENKTLGERQCDKAENFPELVKIANP